MFGTKVVAVSKSIYAGQLNNIKLHCADGVTYIIPGSELNDFFIGKRVVKSEKSKRQKYPRALKVK